MNGVLIVDWENLRTCLRRLGYSHSPLSIAGSLKAKASEFAAASNTRLDRFEIYAPPTGFDPHTMEIWICAGYNLHPTNPEPESGRQELYADTLALLYSRQFDFFIIATGDCDYGALERKIETLGAQCHVWIADPGRSRPGQSAAEILPTLLELPRSQIPGSRLEQPTAFGGVIKVLEGEIERRTKRQLDRSSRKHSTRSTVQAVFDALTDRIRSSGFLPDTIVAWIDQSRQWSGSETVASELAGRLDCSVGRVEVREEGERREIVSTPSLTSSRRVLIVDDAAFSGKTLEMLLSLLRAQNPQAEFQTAVLSAKSPVAPQVRYYGDTHSGDDVLFPWGWARTINEFYDLLRQLGTRDKRWMPRTLQGPVAKATIIENQLCTVEMLSHTSTSNEAATRIDFASHQYDEFLYISSGEVEILIRDTSGTFVEEEFIFIPRVVPFAIETRPGSMVLRVLLGELQAKD